MKIAGATELEKSSPKNRFDVIDSHSLREPFWLETSHFEGIFICKWVGILRKQGVRVKI